MNSVIATQSARILLGLTSLALEKCILAVPSGKWPDFVLGYGRYRGSLLAPTVSQWALCGAIAGLVYEANLSVSQRNGSGVLHRGAGGIREPSIIDRGREKLDSGS